MSPDTPALDEQTQRLLAEAGLFDPEWYQATYPDVAASGLAPLEHFLRFGLAMERDPGPRFDTSVYLANHPDVRTAGELPLAHFLRHGLAEGRRAMPPRAAASRATRLAPVLAPRPVDADWVLMGCGLAERSGIHDAIAALAGELAQRGVRLVMAGNAAPLASIPGADLLATPASLFDYGLHPDWDQGPETPPDWLQEIERITLRWNAADGLASPDDPDDRSRRLHAAYRFWRSLIERGAPAFVFTWGSTTPLSRLQLGICRELGVPALVFERGHLPDTLSVDLVGQFAHGAGLLRPHAFLPGDRPGSSESLARARDWMAARADEGETDRAADEALQALQRAMATHPGKVLLFVGGNDLGAGASYGPDEASECHSRIFPDSRTAAAEVARVLHQALPSAWLLLKPHPVDVQDYAGIEDERIRLVADIPLEVLLPMADAVTGMTTTAFTAALLAGRAVVPLGLTDLAGRGVAYDCPTAAAVPGALMAALHGDGLAARLSRAARYVDHLLDEQLVGTSADAPARLALPDLAEHVRRHVDALGRRHVRDGMSMPHRLADYAASGRALRFVRAAAPAPRPAAARPVVAVVSLPASPDALASCLAGLAAQGGPDRCGLLLVPAPGSEAQAAEIAEGASPRAVEVLAPVSGFDPLARAMATFPEADLLLLAPGVTLPPGALDRLQSHLADDPSLASLSPLVTAAGDAALVQATADGLVDMVSPATESWSQLPCLLVARGIASRSGLPSPGAGTEHYMAHLADLGLRHACARDVIVHVQSNLLAGIPANAVVHASAGVHAPGSSGPGV